MKILITGGAGFVGSHTAEHLHFDCGHEVAVLDNLSTGKRSNLDPKITLFEGDITRTVDLATTFRVFQPDAVVHLAAQPAITTSWSDPSFDSLTNAGGTIEMALWAREMNVKRFVLASTSAVYRKAESPLDETFPLGPDSPYGVSKLAAEGYVRAFLKEYAILRFANVYGPRQVPLGENQVVARMIRHFEHGDTFYINGDGNQVRDYIFVRDVARAIAAAVEVKTGFTVNISSGVGTSVNALAGMMDKIYREDHIWVHTEDEDLRRYAVMRNDRAQYLLGWKPKMSLKDGLLETVEWWKKQ